MVSHIIISYLISTQIYLVTDLLCIVSITSTFMTIVGNLLFLKYPSTVSVNIQQMFDQCQKDEDKRRINRLLGDRYRTAMNVMVLTTVVVVLMPVVISVAELSTGMDRRMMA